MGGIDPEQAAASRHQLAEELHRAGALRSPSWRAALEQVPRHVFLPAFFRPVDTPDRGTLWEPVTGTNDPDAWLAMTYENETWVTQLDHHTTPEHVTDAIPGVPTSSSTLPGLVVAMLEDLDVHDGQRVLEIGTGTGYSTALLCHRLGTDQVTSIEVDPTIAGHAAAALARVGYRPTLVTGDGLAGHPSTAHYDRIIATCSVRHIPPAWLAQAAPGAIILASLSGWLQAAGLARLEIGTDGVAQGRFLPEFVSFMIARDHAAPPLGDLREHITATTAGLQPRATSVGGDIRMDRTGRFVTQLAAPTAQWHAVRVDNGPWIDYYIDATRRSWAALTPEQDGRWSVRQHGALRIWDAVEEAVAAWREAGSPDITAFRLTATSSEQHIWLDTSDGPRWRLPV